MNVTVQAPAQQVADTSQLLHVICTFCHPTAGVAVTRCGIVKEVGPPNVLLTPPSNVCTVCLVVKFDPCVGCGQ